MNVPLSIGFLSTYPPTHCGLATFTASLRGQLIADGAESGVVRVVDRPATAGTAGVIEHLVRGAIATQVKAARALDGFDVVIVQHEFGVYGGVDGDEVLGVCDKLTVPAIVVVHTVPSAPGRHQREVLERVVQRADAVVTMTRTARGRLVNSYDVDPAKIILIPHGAVDPGRSDEPRIRIASATILTWGLLGPGKGIELVIDALPALRGLDRQPLYRVVGRTHPRVLEREGEVYRQTLVARAAARRVADLVVFDGRYLDRASLNRVIAQADIIVLPYQSREQVTSGVLIEAVAAGKPVVATAFPHAVELLSGGSGLVVPHDDPGALARALRRVLVEPQLATSMANIAGKVAPQLRWATVAARYRQLAGSLVTTAASTV